MTTVNWNELRKAAGDAGFSVLAAGEYDLYVESATAAQSASGKDMIKITFKVESGPSEGRKIFTNFVISPDSAVALGFLLRKLNALGLDEEYLDKNPTLEQVAEDLANHRCLAEVTVREWNGQNRNDVNTIKPPSDGVAVRPSGPDPGPGLNVFGEPEHAKPRHHAAKAPDLPF